MVPDTPGPVAKSWDGYALVRKMRTSQPGHHRSKAWRISRGREHPGAALIGMDRSTGVIDQYNNAFGYEHLLVCDRAMPANPGVNLSLTITQ
jgi:choline dehydrogenase-like flavoprotein